MHKHARFPLPILVIKTEVATLEALIPLDCSPLTRLPSLPQATTPPAGKNERVKVRSFHS